MRHDVRKLVNVRSFDLSMRSNITSVLFAHRNVGRTPTIKVSNFV